MAVRRLHPDQPASFAFTPENLEWAKATIAKYPPGKQASAVIPVLWRVQEQIGGWVTEPAIRAVADLLGMPYIRVYEIATFYTMFQLAPVGKTAHVQVCGTTPCMLRGSGELVELCKRRIAEHAHEVSADGKFSWEEVECLGNCANAPMVQIGKDTYEDLDGRILEKIIDALDHGRPVKPGSQSGRVASCPAGGPTTLTTALAYEHAANGLWRHRHPELTSKASAAPSSSATPVASAPVNPAAAAAMANAGIVPALEARAGGKPLAAGTIESLKPAANRQATGLGSGRVAADVVVGAESAGDVDKPQLLAAPRGGRKDDLKLVWGVGPKLEEALNRLGIFHFDQIAAWTARNVKWVDQELEDFRGRAERDKWIEQAKKLATGWRPDNAAGDRPKE